MAALRNFNGLASWKNAENSLQSVNLTMPSHIQRTDRLGRLILVMALALFWAVSVGMWDVVNKATPGEKNRRKSDPATCYAA